MATTMEEMERKLKTMKDKYETEFEALRKTSAELKDKVDAQEAAIGGSPDSVLQ